MGIQKTYGQVVDYTSLLQTKNDAKTTVKKTRKIIKMRLKTPGFNNEWLRIEVNGNTVKPIHTIRTNRSFSGVVNSALGAVSPVPLPNLRFDKWLDSPTTRVVFQPDSCSMSQSPQNSPTQVSQDSQPPQPPQTPTQVSQDSQPTQPPQTPTQVSQDSQPTQPPQTPTQVSQDLQPPQPPQTPTQVSQDLQPPQPPQNSPFQGNQVSQPPQPVENLTAPVTPSLQPPQPPQNSATPVSQMNSLPNCAIAGKDNVLLPEGTDIYKGRFTIEYTQGDLLRSINFKIRDEGA
jgi:hypothetical protein